MLGSYVVLTDNVQFVIALILIVFVRGIGYMVSSKKAKLYISNMFFSKNTIKISKPTQTTAPVAKSPLRRPIVGTIVATFGYVAFLYYPNSYLHMFVFLALLNNLINLWPMGMFDGAKIVPLIDKKLYVAGVIISIVAILKIQSVLLTIYMFITAIQIALSQHKPIHSKTDTTYESKHNISSYHRYMLSLSYFVLIVYQFYMIKLL